MSEFFVKIEHYINNLLVKDGERTSISEPEYQVSTFEIWMVEARKYFEVRKSRCIHLSIWNNMRSKNKHICFCNEEIVAKCVLNSCRKGNFLFEGL